MMLCLLLRCGLQAQPVSDLAGLAFILDPGHSQNENVGIYGYPEAYKVLDVAIHLKEFLTASHADTVVLTRTDRMTSVSITQRYTFANNFPHPDKWFHSIHSDAASIGSPANSILVLISDNCAASSGKICQSRWGETTISMGGWQSDLMTRAYRIPTRGVYGDRTFGYQFGTSYGSAGVGVLRETLMPATLSEGGFHTNPQQNLLNLNNESKRTEAKAIWMAMLGHFGVPRPAIGTLLGVISNVETNAPLNGVTVTLEGRTYTTDTYDGTFKPYCGSDTTCSNGFYYFENLPSGLHTVTFSAPGYQEVSLQVSVIDSFFTFKDLSLLSVVPPRLVSSFPSPNQDGVLPNATATLNFSRALDRPSAEANVSLRDPSNVRVPGKFSWSNADRTLSFKADSLLLMDTTYSLVVGSQVRDLYSHFFDGNGDGVEGDSLVFSFRTRIADVIPPDLLVTAPVQGSTTRAAGDVINMTFNESLDSNTVNTTNIIVQEVGSPLLPQTLRHWQAGGRSGVNAFLTSGLKPGRNYRVRVSGVADQSGNTIPPATPIIWSFSIGTSRYQYTTMESFNTLSADWWQPGASGSTAGLDSADFTFDSTAVPIVSFNGGSARLRYFWRTSASDWLLREYLSGGIPRSVTWRKENHLLQVYVNGDGSGNQFRFAVDDSVDAFPGGSATNHEVSRWYTIDWVGWKLVEWDLEHDSLGVWIGNGRLEGVLRFDSFQLRHVPGTGAPSGQLYFDELRLATRTSTSVPGNGRELPSVFALHQNYPNPFNPTTLIRYDIATKSVVTLSVHNIIGENVAELVNEVQSPGSYQVVFDGSLLPSGVYFYRLSADGGVVTKKMTMVK